MSTTFSMNASMRDTTPEFERIVTERFAGLTPQDRVRMCSSMFDTALAIVVSSLPPGLEAIERKRRICERLHGAELAEKAFPRPE